MLIPEISDSYLYTEVDLDYRPLRDLLALQEWKKADIETRSLIIKASPEGKKGWLNRLDVINLPNTDLITLNKLWVNYSQKRFGFSIQKHIWLSLGGKIDAYTYENYKKFGECVGWFIKAEWLPKDELSEEDGLWLRYDALNFNMNAPKGHLPTAQDGEWFAALTSFKF
ncbi:GUN4 domain-containing protein [Laspinema olomoucense]|uniref:GUN4 domain-containing protein n=1 Tax=Laspinema olomoucense D3b TaxID=2953688 RepID=A0ABT2NEV1_9CYAN|nr:GUN4 domain-containing protein [Laspinema sp. D3b]MCT7981234.1 GUN4 domain-containing protein [Laspinema sp. D3b]